MGLSRDTIESLVTSRQDSTRRTPVKTKWLPNTIDWPIVMWSAARFIFLQGFDPVIPVMGKAGKLANDKAAIGRLADC